MVLDNGRIVSLMFAFDVAYILTGFALGRSNLTRPRRSSKRKEDISSPSLMGAGIKARSMQWLKPKRVDRSIKINDICIYISTVIVIEI